MPYTCEGCKGTFPEFKEPGRCPLCNTWLNVKCASCGYIDTAKSFIENRNCCPKCGSRQAAADDDGPVVMAAVGLFLLFCCVLGGGMMTAGVMNWGEFVTGVRIFLVAIGLVMFLFGAALPVVGMFVDLAPQVEELNLGEKTTESGLESLKRLPRLKILELHSTPVTDAGLMRLADLPLLERLILVRTKVTPEGVKQFTEKRPKVEVVLRD